jgi:ABC-type lipoprotein release transport system permease subunit
MSSFWDENFNNWRRVRFYTYIQLKDKTSAEDVDRKISGVVKDHLKKSNTEIFLQPLKDVHLRSNFEWDLDNYAQGNITYIYIFCLISLGILLIACVNFMNLSTARSAHRAKEVGMRKVTGALRRDIVKQFFGESIVMSFIALFFALLLSRMFLPVLNDFTGKNLSMDLSSSLGILIGLVGITLFTGILSGSYPALYLSSFQPVTVLKNQTGNKKSGSGILRKFLVVFQFSLTVILIIGSVVIFRQLNYMHNSDLGFDKDNVVTFGLRHHAYEAFKNDLLQNPNILSISSCYVPGRELFGVTGFQWEGKNPEEEVMLYPVTVDYDYLETFKMKMVEGRFFSREFSTDEKRSIVLNETAVKVMGLESPVGKRLSFRERKGTIIGVIKDFHQTSLRSAIEPMVFWFPDEGMPWVCARINSQNVSETLAYIEKRWTEEVPNYSFGYSFLDERIGSLYSVEKKIGRIFRYFTILAVFIACLGLFGLASYTAEQRTKEIGIRKVMGAKVSALVLLLSREFTKWVLAANVIAWPIAYFISKNWLQNFSYRVPLGLGVFLFSAAAAFIIALLTVSYQAFKAASAHPVDSLRYE